jgi:DNA-directed RNA polymerase specialized sigma24 family protein
MLGRLVRDAARDREHDLDDYVGELWLCISGYPLARRPVRIAANLALDTAKRVRARSRAVPVDPARLGLLPAPSRGPGERVGLVLARARRADLLDQPSHAALALVYRSGLPGEEAARLLGLSPAALRQRCRRAVQRLAAYAEDLMEVA